MNNLSIQHAFKALKQLSFDDFEIYYERKASTIIDAKDQKTDSLSRTEDVGIAVRAIKNKKLGFSFTTSCDPLAIEKAVKTVGQISEWMPSDQHVKMRRFSDAQYRPVHWKAFDETGIHVPISEKIHLAQALEAKCRAADSRISGIRKATLSESIVEFALADSNGREIEFKRTLFSASVTCKAESGGDSQISGDYGFHSELGKLDIDSISAQAAQWATELLGAQGAPTMRCPAIFRNSVVADLAEFLSSSFSAEEIFKGRSLLGGKKGQKIFSEKLTLIDDGLLPGGLAASPFDGEGTPRQKTVLVDRGILAGLLCDVYYGEKLEMSPTGNAARGIKSPPVVQPSNLVFQPGTKSFADLCSIISNGIVITDLMGIHTANPVTGDFSLGASGILIENGKLTRPVRGFAVAGNILGVLKGITEVGSDFRFFGNIGAPSVSIDELSIGGVS